ncbi:MAG TPA: CBS domain-containing protein [Methanospirillum sp.]|uniref:CBS domain-containing protein n=1 Tax=Methanospirillum sp. TaxID=45200 RepID=UPI002CA6D0BF|nr:CBS domain-containing protein [Methanospirillum sp.]HWQ64641.1 CBS domain-containing protein [Methanospirillum sp.]
MSSPVRVCGPDDTISYVRNLMLKHHISRVLVMEGQRVIGIITKKDIGYRLRSRDPAWRRRSPDNEPVSSVMTADIISISPGSSIHDALVLMVTHKISGFPVIDQGMVLGMVTKSDMIRSPLVKSLDRPVSGVMHDVQQVTKEHSLDHVIDLMRSGCGKVVVTGEDGTMSGIISESDLTFAQEGRTQPEKLKAGDVMRSPVTTLDDTARTGDVIREMAEKHISSLIITNGQGLKGIITRDDIIGEVVL